MSDSDVFDYEGMIESAVQSALQGIGLTVITSADNPDLQKDRPRAEVEFTLGAGLLRYVRAALPADLAQSKVDSAFKGSLTVAIITGADENGKSTMGEYRAKVRRIMLGLPGRVNGTALTTLRIPLIKESGNARVIRPQDGYEELRMTYDIDFSIQADAWSKLS